MDILQQPVTGEELFDREALLETLGKGGKNFALIGPRKSGKTSLMWEIQPVLEMKGFLSPYIYVFFEDTDSSFLVRYVNLCLLQFLRKKSVEQIEMVFEDSLDTLDEQVTRAIELKPRLAKHLLTLRDALHKPPDFGILELVLKLPAALISDEDTKFMLLIDEFQNVSSLSLPVIDMLRKQIMTDSRVNYLVAGSEIGMMKDILENSAAPLFGHFSIHKVGAFTIDQSRFYILQFLMKKKLVIGEMGLSFLVTLTGGFPFFINTLLEKITLKCEERAYQRIPNDVLIDAIEETSFRTDGALYIHFKDTLEKTFKKRNMGKYLSILKAIAQGNHTIKKIAVAIMGRSTSLPVYLDFLQMTELICKADNGYQLTDPFLEFWLKACLRVQESTALSTKEKLSAFQKSAQDVLSCIRSQLGKAREAQIREMFFLSDDYVKTGSGMRDGEEFDLITYKNNKLILGEIKTGDVTLAEVLTFAEKLDRVKPKQKAIGFLFVLGTIYPDALNAASEKNIEIWDLQRINGFRKKLKLEKLSI